jgi:hypothetical protein
MKLGDIEISESGVMIALYAIWGYFGIMALMTILMIVKAIAFYCFDYKIVIAGTPL